MRPDKALDGKTSALPTYIHGIEKCVFMPRLTIVQLFHGHLNDSII